MDTQMDMNWELAKKIGEARREHLGNDFAFIDAQGRRTEVHVTPINREFTLDDMDWL